MDQPQKVIILGAGGFARELLWAFKEANFTSLQWEVLGFIDEDKGKHGAIVCDLPVFGGFDWFEGAVRQNMYVLSGVGSTRAKQRLADVSKRLGLRFCSLIHPDTQMSQYVSIGCGTVITAGNIITTQVIIGEHVTINLGCTIGHDCLIGDFCTIAPGVHLSGNVMIGEGANLGTGCIILPGIKVGKWSRIGAGAVVVKNIPDGVTAMGVPARIVEKGDKIL